MLEPGCHFFSCEVIRSLSANSSYQSYLARSADDRSVRLLIAAADKVDRQGALTVAQQLIDANFNGVVAPLSAEICDDQFTCVYPVCDGQTLADQIGQGHMSAGNALETLHSLVKLLIAPHRAGLAHGNISPANIILTADGYCLDNYSLTRMFALDYQSGLDPAYTSPEQVRGETGGVASDIYSLGCLLYQMLTGEAPFRGGDAFTVAMQHLQENFPALPAEHSCRLLLEQLTRPDPDERPGSQAALVLIEQLLDSEAVDHVAVSDAPDEETVNPEQTDTQGSFSPEGENLDYTARIEARLKEYSAVMSTPSEDDISDDSEIAVVRDPLPKGEKFPFWRYALILLTGILVGSGSYFLFFNHSTEPIPAVAVAGTDGNIDISERLDQALSAWQNAEHAAAIASFEEIVESHPDDPRASNNLAAIYAARGDYEQARQYLERALKTDPDYTTIYNNLAAVYAEMARDSYGKALQLDQDQKRLQLIALSGQGAVEVNSLAEQAVPVKSAPLDAELTVQVVSGGQALQVQPDVAVKVEASSTVNVPTSELESPQAVALENVPVPVSEPGVIETAALDPPVEEVAAPASAVQGADEFMQRWAQAWSRQNVEEYLACYDDNFIPPGGRTRSAWETERETRISRPEKIVVELLDAQVAVQENGIIRYETIQTYESDRYADRTRKVFDLRLNEGRWSIIRERSLGRIR